MAPAGVTAMTAVELSTPSERLVVPSIGSTAISMSGGALGSPIRSPR
jgi:hypothetical protein